MKHQVQTDQGPEPSSATYEPRSGASPSQPQSSSVKWGCATPPPRAVRSRGDNLFKVPGAPQKISSPSGPRPTEAGRRRSEVQGNV